MGAPGLARGTRVAPKDSTWPCDGGNIDAADKWLSRPIFRLQLGRTAEWLLSIPGNFFGMPATLLVSPTAIGCAVGGCSHAHSAALALAIICAVALTARWAAFNVAQDGSASSIALILYQPSTVVVAPVLGTALAHCIVDPGPGRHAASFHITAWFAGVTPVLYLKQLTSRRRPVASKAEHVGQAAVAAASAKQLSNIPAMLLRSDCNASFPSGDVGAAAAVSYILVRWCGYTKMAVACVALSAFGRMYWQAHHLLDVVAGALVSLVTCRVVDALYTLTSSGSASGACPNAAWWHPALAMLVLLAQQWAQKRNNTTSRGQRP